MVATPTIYVPTIPGFRRCPTPARGGGSGAGRGIIRGGGRDGGRGGRDGGRQGKGTIFSRIGPSVVASAEGSAPAKTYYECPYCHNNHGPTGVCWYIDFHWEAIACVTDDSFISPQTF